MLSRKVFAFLFLILFAWADFSVAADRKLKMRDAVEIMAAQIVLADVGFVVNDKNAVEVLFWLRFISAALVFNAILFSVWLGRLVLRWYTDKKIAEHEASYTGRSYEREPVKRKRVDKIIDGYIKRRR